MSKIYHKYFSQLLLYKKIYAILVQLGVSYNATRHIDWIKAAKIQFDIATKYFEYIIPLNFTYLFTIQIFKNLGDYVFEFGILSGVWNLWDDTIYNIFKVMKWFCHADFIVFNTFGNFNLEALESWWSLNA